VDAAAIWPAVIATAATATVETVSMRLYARLLTAGLMQFPFVPADTPNERGAAAPQGTQAAA
jgi:hypothetical protein